jgi:hypothetical protein
MKALLDDRQRRCHRASMRSHSSQRKLPTDFSQRAHTFIVIATGAGPPAMDDGKNPAAVPA